MESINPMKVSAIWDVIKNFCPKLFPKIVKNTNPKKYPKNIIVKYKFSAAASFAHLKSP